jgi:hypothetical protein
MKKTVLDKFGEAWGYVDVPEDIKNITVAGALTIDGTPVNVTEHKLSVAKKHHRTFERDGGYELFIKKEHQNRVFYVTG